MVDNPSPFDLHQLRLYGGVATLIPDSLFFCSLHHRPRSDSSAVFFFVDDDVHYESFYSDFGPLNLSVLYRFCRKLYTIRLKAVRLKRRVVVCSSAQDEMRVNAAFLIGAFAIIYLDMPAMAAMSALQAVQPPKLIAFRDAAMGASTYDLHLHDVLRAVEKAVALKWLNFHTFNADEYEFYERVENGDLNWIIPNKILSFCGPHNKSIVENGYPYHAPEVYFDYFRRNNVTTIIRLNKKMYDAKRFTQAGFEHVDLFFVDGSTPSDNIVRRFIQVVDNARGAVAVHCKAGLGRTGTLIACWMMKEYGLTAAECMAWTRICRPGSIIGPQQQFLIEQEKWCQAMGETQVGSPERSPAQLTQLVSKVDDIRLSEPLKQRAVMQIMRPIVVVPRRTTRRSNERSPVSETTLTATGESQGDRLLQIKASRQHQHQTPARFSSPTTPIKPVVSATHARMRTHVSAGALLLSERKFDHLAAVPIARVTVTATRPPIIKSTSNLHPARKLSGARVRPYPPSPGRLVELPASTYALRSRKSYSPPNTSDEINKRMPPNTGALLAPRRNLSKRL